MPGPEDKTVYIPYKYVPEDFTGTTKEAYVFKINGKAAEDINKLDANIAKAREKLIAALVDKGYQDKTVTRQEAEKIVKDYETAVGVNTSNTISGIVQMQTPGKNRGAVIDPTQGAITQNKLENRLSLAVNYEGKGPAKDYVDLIIEKQNYVMETVSKCVTVYQNSADKKEADNYKRENGISVAVYVPAPSQKGKVVGANSDKAKPKVGETLKLADLMRNLPNFVEQPQQAAITQNRKVAGTN